jgi:hypothetical protein
MPSLSSTPVALLQAASVPDTIVTKTVAVRSLFDYTGGILEIVVLLTAVVALVATAGLLVAMRKGVLAAQASVEKLTEEARPLLRNASDVVRDARITVDAVRRDVERLSGAAGAIGDELRHVADLAAERIDDVNAVLDVVQDELEQSAISTVSALRGVRVGALALGSALGGGGRRRGRDRAERSSDAPERPARRRRADPPDADVASTDDDDDLA